jgi:thiamine-monophosphate kinase
MGKGRERLSELGENKLVDRIIASLPDDASIIVGAGDDCAVVEIGNGPWQLLKTDCLIEGVHFLPGTDPELVGRKSINRVLSDIAAMGGIPRHAVVTLVCDAGRELEEVDGWYTGINAAAAAAGCFVVGGETARLNNSGVVLSVAMTGEVDRDSCVLRSGAKAGDIIAVTGRLGGSFESERHLRFEPRLEQAQWLVKHFKPNAMMDLSDGLGSDLPRMARASGVGFDVKLDAIPSNSGIGVESAVAEGEDYELLIAVPADTWAALDAMWQKTFHEVMLTSIGTITEGSSGDLPAGWEYFTSE